MNKKLSITFNIKNFNFKKYEIIYLKYKNSHLLRWFLINISLSFLLFFANFADDIHKFWYK